MAIKRYKCGNPKCQALNQGVFLAEKPTCPQCLKSMDDPKFGRMIIRQPFIHFDPPSEIEGIGEGHRACDSDKCIQAETTPGGMPNPWHAGTGNVTVVNCPACMATDAYKAALKRAEEEDDDGLTNAALARLEPLKRVF